MNFENVSNRAKITVIIILLCICVFLTYYFHVILHVGTVFSHFFYIPIILGALWWRKKALIIPFFLAILLIVSHVFLRPYSVTLNDYFRSLLFILVGLVVVFLSDKIVKMNQDLEAFNRDLISKEKELREQTNNLSERVKELNCLQMLSKVVDTRSDSLDGMLQGIVDELHVGFQYPEITVVRLKLGEKVYQTDNFRETPWKLAARVVVDSEIVSYLEVYILKEMPEKDEGPFVKEERNLLNIVAERLGKIIKRKQAEIALKESGSILLEQKRVLEQKNMVFREMLEQIEIEKKIIKDNVSASIENLMLPVFKKLKRKGSRIDAKYIDLLETSAKDIASSFSDQLSSRKNKLTPREIEICNMIKSGLAGKEIASLLNIEFRTIETHRNNIRKKLGISNKDINLTTYLRTL